MGAATRVPHTRRAFRLAPDGPREGSRERRHHRAGQRNRVIRPRRDHTATGRYLAASGGPADMGRALLAYNHSNAYVTAVEAYARVMLADARAYDGYYQWQVYYSTTSGVLLLPEGYGVAR